MRAGGSIWGWRGRGYIHIIIHALASMPSTPSHLLDAGSAETSAGMDQPINTKFIQL